MRKQISYTGLQLLTHYEKATLILISNTIPFVLVNNEDVKMTFCVLAESVAARLREYGFKYKMVQISARGIDLI